MQTASPATAGHVRRRTVMALMLAGGTAAGAAAWLWMQHGLAVYVTQATTFAWSCF